MRRREAWLVGVLVPCAALVGVGWWLTRSAPSTEPSDSLPNPAATSASRSAALREPVPLAMGPGQGSPDAGSGSEESLKAPLAAVRSELQLCFDDRRLGPVRLSVAFRPTPDGGFQEVEVTSDASDPTFNACVEDVFAEVRFVPTGRESFRLESHTFLFDRPRR